MFFSTQLTEIDWKYYAEPSPKACLGMKANRCYWPRGKCMGGSSSINAMLYLRGSKHDYDDWANMGNQGWEYESLKRYFERIEHATSYDEYYGRNGKVYLKKYDCRQPIKYAIKDAAKSIGYGMEDHENLMGFFECYINVKNGERHSASQAYISEITSSNFYLAMHSLVTKIIINKNTKTAEGVEVKIGDKLLKLRAKKEIIISAGSVNTPVILMHSGIGPKQHLEEMNIDVVKNLPVGENLQDHLVHNGIMLKLQNEHVINRTIYNEVINYFLHREGMLAGVDMTNFLGFINTRNVSANRPNIQYHHIKFPKNDNYLLRVFLGSFNFNEEIVKSYFDYNKNNHMYQIVTTLLNPKSKGRILLKNANPFDKPIIQANYLENPDDVDTLLEGINFLEKLIETKPLSDMNLELLPIDIPNCRGLEFRSKEYWLCTIRNVVTSVYHPVGTCKMGVDNTSVVNPKLQVYGIDNLRVADASIMPKIISANTNAASMMIGEKASDLIKIHWRKESPSIVNYL